MRGQREKQHETESQYGSLGAACNSRLLDSWILSPQSSTRGAGILSGFTARIPLVPVARWLDGSSQPVPAGVPQRAPTASRDHTDSSPLLSVVAELSSACLKSRSASSIWLSRWSVIGANRRPKRPTGGA